MRKCGPPGASSNGFNENLTLFASGKLAMWIDATVAGGTLSNPAESQVVDKVAYASAPIDVTPKGAHWLWSWCFAIPSTTRNAEVAKKFALWATSKAYIQMAAQDAGWAAVPPGTRKSTYDNPAYQQAAPFARVTLQALQTADPNDQTLHKVPYTGIQLVGVPEFQAFGTVTGQSIAGALAGKMTVEQALQIGQNVANRMVKQAGYQKKE
jgi:sorbitol/mannitol transport system substrate-binding protein